MRVLLVLHHGLTSDAGAPGATLALGDALERQGCSVDYFSFNQAFGASAPEDVAHQLRFPLQTAYFLKRRARDFDVVDASTGDAWAWGSLRRPGRASPQALITRAHGLEHVVSHNARAAALEGAEQLSWKYPLYHGGLRLWEVRRSLRVADHCVMLNEGDRDWARERLGVPGDRISVMPNAIAPHFVSAPDVTGPGEGPVKLAFVGGWISRKGTAELVEAMRLLEEDGLEFSLSLLGTGQSKSTLADFPADLRARISVTPHYANEDLPGLLANREILVFPSHSEGSSVALLEAMASGLAPLATRVGSAAETIKPGDDGRLVDAGDAPAVAQAVKEMASDRIALAAMRRAAQEKARAHSWDQIASDTVALYERVLTTCAKGRPRP